MADTVEAANAPTRSSDRMEFEDMVILLNDCGESESVDTSRRFEESGRWTLI
jgi:hypothetical protein